MNKPPVRPCPACGAPLRPGAARVCRGCRPAWIVCPECGLFGRRATPTAKRCEGCHRRPYETPVTVAPPPEVDPTRGRRLEALAERAARG